MSAIVDAYDALLLDLDGVLFRGRTAVPGAVEAVAALRRRETRLRFVTNNAMRTVPQVVDHLASMGFAVDGAEVVTSALATADWLRQQGCRSAYVVGQDGLRGALRDAGIEVVGMAERMPDHVVVGADLTATYASLRDAGLLVQRGATLVACNPDTNFPAEDGLWPGAGALLAVIVATTGATPIVIGKPGTVLFRSAAESCGARRPLVVGDRLDTDIAGAVALGWDSALVLSGVSTRAEAEASTVRPTFVVEALGDLLRPAPERG